MSIAFGDQKIEDFLSMTELTRRLKTGAPLLVEGETVRLPRFTDVREVEPEELGVKAKPPLVVATARTAVWCLWLLDRKTRFEKRDADRFLALVAALAVTTKDKPVTGVVMTGGPVCPDSKRRIEKAGHKVYGTGVSRA